MAQRLLACGKHMSKKPFSAGFEDDDLSYLSGFSLAGLQLKIVYLIAGVQRRYCFRLLSYDIFVCQAYKILTCVSLESVGVPLSTSLLASRLTTMSLDTCMQSSYAVS